MSMKPWTLSGVEWDADGYPTEESLDALKAQPLNFFDAAKFVIETIGDADNPYAMISINEGTDGFTGEPVKRVLFSTGGWSGNEDLIGVATDRFDVAHFLRQWNAGGHFQFQVPLAMLDEAKQARRRAE